VLIYVIIGRKRDKRCKTGIDENKTT
jgi:hypothetical protein